MTKTYNAAKLHEFYPNESNYWRESYLNAKSTSGSNYMN